jgi:hypothetical protein
VQVWSTDVPSLAEARRIEKEIKSRGARRFLNGQGISTDFKRE